MPLAELGGADLATLAQENEMEFGPEEEVSKCLFVVYSKMLCFLDE